MRSKEDFWQMIAASAVFARQTPEQAAKTADELVMELGKRTAKWDEEERRARES